MGLLGPNGAGKTTLIKILATLVSADKGTGSISGYSLSTQSAEVRNKIGLVSTNDRTFYWRLTGRDNLDFFATLYNLNGAAKKRRIDQVLQLTQLIDYADFRFMSYSAGQKQRLSIARALLSRPDILLLDEATSSLDPIARRKVLDFTKNILSIKEEKTILWCTHNLTEANEICDSLTILNNGKVLQSGSADAIRNRKLGQCGFSITVSGSDSVIMQQRDFKIVTRHRDGSSTWHVSAPRNQIPEIIRNLSNSGVDIFEVLPESESLETVFTTIVAKPHPGTCHVE